MFRELLSGCRILINVLYFLFIYSCSVIENCSNKLISQIINKNKKLKLKDHKTLIILSLWFLLFYWVILAVGFKILKTHLGIHSLGFLINQEWLWRDPLLHFRLAELLGKKGLRFRVFFKINQPFFVFVSKWLFSLEVRSQRLSHFSEKELIGILWFWVIQALSRSLERLVGLTSWTFLTKTLGHYI